MEYFAFTTMCQLYCKSWWEESYGLPVYKLGTCWTFEQNSTMCEHQFLSEQLLNPSVWQFPDSRGKANAGDLILLRLTKRTCLSTMTMSNSIWKHTR